MSDNIVSKLSKVVGALGSFAPDKTNTQQRYDYISADQVLSRVGVALAAEGIMIIPAISEEAVELVNPKPNQTRYDATVALEMNITDGESSMVQQWVGRGSDYGVPDKALYKAITSGHKYFLMKLFNIGVGNDDGEHEESPQSAQKKQTQKPPQNNGNVTNYAPLPDDEQTIVEAPAAEFFTVTTALIDRFTHEKHTKNAAKKLGVTSISGAPDDRRLLYLRLKEYARARDAEESAEGEAIQSELKQQGKRV